MTSTETKEGSTPSQDKTCLSNSFPSTHKSYWSKFCRIYHYHRVFLDLGRRWKQDKEWEEFCEREEIKYYSIMDLTSNP